MNYADLHFFLYYFSSRTQFFWYYFLLPLALENDITILNPRYKALTDLTWHQSSLTENTIYNVKGVAACGAKTTENYHLTAVSFGFMAHIFLVLNLAALNMFSSHNRQTQLAL